MIFKFDEAQLKHIADVIETEARVRERLYHELKWNNQWSPCPASRVTRLRQKDRPRSAKARPSSAKNASCDNKARPSSAKHASRDSRDDGVDIVARPASARHKTHTTEDHGKDNFQFDFEGGKMKYRQRGGESSKLKSFAINVGEDSKKLAIGWCQDPKTFTVDFGNGFQYRGSSNTHAQKGTFSITTPSGGRSFQVESQNPKGGDASVVIRTTKPPQRLRNTQHCSEGRGRRSGHSDRKHKDRNRVPGGSRRSGEAKEGEEDCKHRSDTVGNDGEEARTTNVNDSIQYGRQRKHHSKKKRSRDEDETSDSRRNNSSREEGHDRDCLFSNNNKQTTNRLGKTSVSLGTQTTWMDTVADGPPQQQKAPQGVRYMGERHRHKTTDPPTNAVTIDDSDMYRSIRSNDKKRSAEEEFPLVVEVTRSVEDEGPDTRPIGPQTREIVHYIDGCGPKPEFDLYEPIYVLPHRQGRTTAPTKPKKTSTYKPLALYEYVDPQDKEKYLVIEEIPVRRQRQPPPVLLRTRTEHNRNHLW